MRNNRGLTLVEVLATLTILSIAGIIIWQVFFQGINYSQKTITKNMMMQEANIITTSLLKVHQTVNSYEIGSIHEDSPCGIIIKYNGESQVFDPEQICVTYTTTLPISPTGGQIVGGIGNMPDVPLTLTLTDKNNTNNSIDVKTTLYRLGRETVNESPE
jgi:prepilin-type N-terminal cleavage/methylation domain-containing protein